MDITIKYKFNLEVLLIIFLLYLILITNVFCSCCNIEKIIQIVKNSFTEQKPLIYEN